MKKTGYFALVICFIFMSMVLVSCGGAKETSSVNPETQQESSRSEKTEPAVEEKLSEMKTEEPHVMMSGTEQTAEENEAENQSNPEKQKVPVIKPDGTPSDSSPGAIINEEVIECSIEANGYVIQVDSAFRGKDYNGNDVAIVRYNFTNNNASGAAYWEVAKDTVSQHGIPVSSEGVIVAGDEFFTFTQQVSNGQTVPVQFAYPVTDFSSPLDVTIAVYNYNTASVIASASTTMTIR